MKTWSATLMLTLAASTVFADPLKCDLTGYKAAPGLTAAVADDTLSLAWDGDNSQELRLRFTHRRRHADDQGAGAPEERRPVGDAGDQRDAGVPRRVRPPAGDAAADASRS